MIKIIDNLGYTGNQPNFERDNMTWEKMQTISMSNLDLGHVVYCTSEDNRGHWVFLGVDKEYNALWKKIINADGSVPSTANVYEEIIKDNTSKSVTILSSIHNCGKSPDVTVYYQNQIVIPDVEINNSGDVLVSWGNVNITEENPLTIKITGK